MMPLARSMPRVPLSATPMPLEAAPQMMLDPAFDPASTLDHLGSTVAFADQSGKLAGTFFMVSLFPYIAFLYFLGYEKNNVPKTAYFGFQFLLLFVISTVFTGIVTKGTYSSTLADVDWLHGGAEALLTTTNLYVASGFRNAMAGDKDPEGGSFRYPAFGVFALVVLFTAIGPSVLGLEQHSAFLFGLGTLPENPLGALAAAAEPDNALSIPTWAIHFSSVFEWLFAMGMVNQYAVATGNEKWKALTWGMLPLHASGVAACTYHFFYNSPDVGFLVTLQAFLTLLGNSTVCIAAVLIALSNGWNFQDAIADANPFNKEEKAAYTPPPLKLQEMQSTPLIAAELLLLTVISSYLMKYGETLLGITFEPETAGAILGGLICLGIPSAVGYRFYSLPKDQGSSTTAA